MQDDIILWSGSFLNTWKQFENYTFLNHKSLKDMKEIYSILTYNLMDNVSFQTYKSQGKYHIISERRNNYGPVFECQVEDGSKVTFESNRYGVYSSNISPDMFNYEDKLLPYFADVKEDLPGWVAKKVKAEVFENLQLMTEKHGGYLQFWDPVNQEAKRIAMNSNTYTPRYHHETK